MSLVHCGSEVMEEGGEADTDGLNFSESEGVSLFENAVTGDSFEWGKFIHDPYQSTEVGKLPVPVYLAFFTEDEKAEIKEGVEIANHAVGFEVFEIVDEWSERNRLIYKVDSVYFDGDTAGIDNFDVVIGYTYNRNIYLNDKYDAGRVVTDWAMEIRTDHVTRWVAAHELGHAMGIQKHALINYETDSLEDLENNSLMSAVVGTSPALSDYEYMMRRQGELLQEYLQSI